MTLVTIRLAHTFQCFPINPSIMTWPAIVPSAEEESPDASRVRMNMMAIAGPNNNSIAWTKSLGEIFVFGYRGVAIRSIPALTTDAIVRASTDSLRWNFLVLSISPVEYE